MQQIRKPLLTTGATFLPRHELYPPNDSNHETTADPERHWTMYWLASKKIVHICHLYQNGTMSKLWDVDEETAIRGKWRYHCSTTREW